MFSLRLILLQFYFFNYIFFIIIFHETSLSISRLRLAADGEYCFLTIDFYANHWFSNDLQDITNAEEYFDERGKIKCGNRQL